MLIQEREGNFQISDPKGKSKLISISPNQADQGRSWGGDWEAGLNPNIGSGWEF